jgi:hypothetical protein
MIAGYLFSCLGSIELTLTKLRYFSSFVKDIDQILSYMNYKLYLYDANEPCNYLQSCLYDSAYL